MLIETLLAAVIAGEPKQMDLAGHCAQSLTETAEAIQSSVEYVELDKLGYHNRTYQQNSRLQELSSRSRALTKVADKMSVHARLDRVTTLTPDNSSEGVDICVRLDQIPNSIWYTHPATLAAAK